MENYPKNQQLPPPYSSDPPPMMQQPYPQVPQGSQGPPMVQMVPMSTVMVSPGVVTPGMVTVIPALGTQPTAAVCRSCNAQIITQTRPNPAVRTHLFALLLCLFGCWPCVCLPYCMDSCMNIDHHCPNCQSYIGSYVG